MDFAWAKSMGGSMPRPYGTSLVIRKGVLHPKCNTPILLFDGDLVGAQVLGHHGVDSGGDVHGGHALQLLGGDHAQHMQVDVGPAEPFDIGGDVLGAVEGADHDGYIRLLGDLEHAGR